MDSSFRVMENLDKKWLCMLWTTLFAFHNLKCLFLGCSRTCSFLSCIQLGELPPFSIHFYASFGNVFCIFLLVVLVSYSSKDLYFMLCIYYATYLLTCIEMKILISLDGQPFSSMNIRRARGSFFHDFALSFVRWFICLFICAFIRAFIYSLLPSFPP